MVRNNYLTYLSIFVFLVCVSACNHTDKKQSLSETGMESDSSSERPMRFGMVTGLKPEKVSYYKDLHANTWEGVLKAIKEYNIENYSIYLQKIDEIFFLFSYFQYVGNNYEEDMKKIAADTTAQRWWQETDPCQIPLPEAASQNQIWTTMEEVFHTN